MILTVVIGFERMNEQKFLRCKDCKPVLRYKKDVQSVNMNNEREPNCSLMKVYVLTKEVYVSFAEICGTGNKYILFLLLMAS